MGKKLAIVVIHGMGSQDKDRPTSPTDLTFSKDLHKRIKRTFGATDFDAKVAWREIFWADILQEQQQKFLKNNKGRFSRGPIRNFVLNNLGDAAGYRKTDDDKDQTYELIHDRVFKAIAGLDDEVDDDARLIVLAHSLGGHIMSNYIYDVTKNDRDNAPRDGTNAFQRLETMVGFFTFGCNIPIFTFAYKPDDIYPIWFPGIALPPSDRSKTWWQNYYDKDDVLGYPLSKVSPHYTALAKSGGLKDKAIDSGNLLTAWNALSHNAYWRDEDFYRPVVKFMKSVKVNGQRI